MLLFLLVVGGLMAWPTAAASQRDLNALYAGKVARVVRLKDNYFLEGCGEYRLRDDPRRWKFTETKAGLYAEEASGRWRTGGDASPEGARWRACERHQRRGRGADLYPLYDWLAVMVLGVTNRV